MRTFLRVTLPLSWPSILAGSVLIVLPMFGDYYTNDLISGSPHTNMLGNSVNLLVQGGSQKNLGAALVLVLMTILAVGMLYYLWETDARGEARVSASDEARAGPPRRAVGPAQPSADWLGNPWGRPRFLALTTWVYIAWSLLPVLAAIVFSFNDGRSRSVWQGFSTRWWWGDPNLSVFHDPIYTNALVHSLELAALDMLIATPLGFLLAIGLSRWRGRGSGAANFLMLVPLTTPELAMAVSLLLVFTQLSILPFTRDRARHHRPGDRPGHLLGLLRGGDRAQPAGRDRPRIRGGGARPRRLGPPVAPARAAAAAPARRLRLDPDRLRPLDRRLRRHPVHVGGRRNDDDPDAALRQRPRRRDDAGAERGGDDHGAGDADRGRRRLPGAALVRAPQRRSATRRARWAWT